MMNKAILKCINSDINVYQNKRPFYVACENYHALNIYTIININDQFININDSYHH